MEGINMNKTETTNPSDREKSLWVLGDLYTFKVSGEDTNANYAVLEVISYPNNGPPPHIHHREDEGFYVLDGEFSFLYCDRTFKATSGDFIHIPRGMPHTFNNL